MAKNWKVPTTSNHHFSDESPTGIGDVDWSLVVRILDRVYLYPASQVDHALRGLLDALCSAVGAQSGFCVTGIRPVADRGDRGDPLGGWRPREVVYVRIPELHLRLRRQWSAQQDNVLYDPMTQALVRTASTGTTQAFLRRQLLDDRTWKSSSVVRDLLSAIDVGDRLAAIVPLDSQVTYFLVFDRGRHQPHFDPANRDLLGLLAQLTRPLFLRLARCDGLMDAQLPLTPRERELVRLLLAGDSEKQLARRLGLSVGSTHQLVRKIFRKYGVHSRVELMALILANEPRTRNEDST